MLPIMRIKSPFYSILFRNCTDHDERERHFGLWFVGDPAGGGGLPVCAPPRAHRHRPHSQDHRAQLPQPVRRRRSGQGGGAAR